MDAELDDEVASVVQASPAATYAIRNSVALRRGVSRYSIKCAHVLKSLRRLERLGLVEESTRHIYARQLAWCLPKPKSAIDSTRAK